jgi:acyl-coenzyme A thioesterase PaaI-like protein
MTYTEFIPQADHQGYDGVVHGGILAALLDDAMANCLWLRGVPAPADVCVKGMDL